MPLCEEIDINLINEDLSKIQNKQLAKIDHGRKESGRKGWKTYKETPTVLVGNKM